MKNNGIKLCKYKIKTSRYILQKILHSFHFCKELRIQEIIIFKNNQEETWDVKENIFKHFLYVSVIYRRWTLILMKYPCLRKCLGILFKICLQCLLCYFSYMLESFIVADLKLLSLINKLVELSISWYCQSSARILFFLIDFYWSILALQCYANLCYTESESTPCIHGSPLL